MKDLLDTVFDTLLWLMLWGMGLYAILSFAAYSVAAEDLPELTHGQKIIAHTILGEARGEGEAGMYAVAAIIKQRTINRKMTPSKVCLQSRLVKGKRVYQFSFWNKDDANRNTVRRLMMDPNPIDKVVYAKRLAIHFDSVNCNYTRGADHYCTLETNPYWAKNKAPVLIIKNHKFYKLR